MPAGSWWPIMFNPSFPIASSTRCIAAYPHHRVAGRRGRRLASVRDRANAARAEDVLHGDVDGGASSRRSRSSPVTCRVSTRSKYQPAKVLAMEGDFDPSPHGAPLVLFGMPSNDEAARHDRIEIPKLGSLILEHDPNAPLQGTQGFPARAMAAGADRVLVVPHHGRTGHRHAGLGVWSLLARVCAPALRLALLHRAAVLMGPAGLHRGDRRLGDHRGGSAALSPSMACC